MRAAGTFGNGTELSQESQCADVDPGFYSPTGSKEPIACPTWGLCPGRAFDTDNVAQGLPPGSQPIGVQGGQQVVRRVVQQSVVQQEVQLQTSNTSSVNETAFRHHMALSYGVPVEAIKLTLSKQQREEEWLREYADAVQEEGEQRRKLHSHHHRALQASSGLLRLTYTLEIDPIAANVSVASLTATVQSASVGIMNSLSAALNVTVACAFIVTGSGRAVFYKLRLCKCYSI